MEKVEQQQAVKMSQKKRVRFSLPSDYDETKDLERKPQNKRIRFSRPQSTKTQIETETKQLATEDAAADEFDFGVNLSRISMAYGNVDHVPDEIIDCVGKQLLCLDLSHNNFRNLRFLRRFSMLETLILDRNCKLDLETLPIMRSLRVLWLNNCNLTDIGDWVMHLGAKCRHIEELSMMCNPVGDTVLNGVSEIDELKYRRQFIRALPNLKIFDGAAVTEEERRNALKWSEVIYQKVDKQVKNISTLLQGK